MLYEICAVIMIFIILIVWVSNPVRQLYRKYGGKSLDIKDKDHPDYDERLTRVIVIFIHAVGFIIFNIMEILFMFWTDGQGVFLAKYYALFLIIFTIFMVVKAKLKKKGLKSLPKKQKISSIIYDNITTVITIALIVWALVI